MEFVSTLKNFGIWHIVILFFDALCAHNADVAQW